MNHEQYMTEALAMAEAMLAQGSIDVPIAALIVKDDQIIARGTNTREKNKSILEHAEINALQMATEFTGSWNLSECTIYINLEPCPMCAGAIIQAHIRNVVFAAYDIKSGAFGSRYNISTNLMNITGGILENRAKNILSEFFKEKRYHRLDNGNRTP
jgi:tRNA(adenine34) deaminase